MKSITTPITHKHGHNRTTCSYCVMGMNEWDGNETLEGVAGAFESSCGASKVNYQKRGRQMDRANGMPGFALRQHDLTDHTGAGCEAKRAEHQWVWALETLCSHLIFRIRALWSRQKGNLSQSQPKQIKRKQQCGAGSASLTLKTGLINQI